MNKDTLLRSPLGLLAVGISLLAFFLVFQSAGLTPSIFSDEYTYSRLSRFLPLEDAKIPSYLYLALFGLTNYCGEGFLGCARVLNAGLFSLALPFIYLSCRLVAPPRYAFAVAILAVAGPINTYTAYFMPESGFFLVFWGFCALFLRLDASSRRRLWLIAGCIYGASALVKVHALFFLPALTLYALFVFKRAGRQIRSHALTCLLTFLLGAGAVKFLGGYALAGRKGLTLFGTFYAAYTPGIDHYLELIAPSIESVKGHIWGLALAYGVPLAMALSLVIGLVARAAGGSGSQAVPQSEEQLERVALFALLLIGSLIAVAALYTASVIDSGPYETPYRLHVRYYNFALPLFYMIAAGGIHLQSKQIPNYLRYGLGALLVAVSVLALDLHLAPYVPSHIDSPEIFGLLAAPETFYPVAGLLLVSVMAWIIRPHLGTRLYVYLALPVFVGVTYFQVIKVQRAHLVEDVYDRAGLFVKQVLPEEALSKTLVIGSELGPLYRVLFHIDHPATVHKPMAPASQIDLAEIPSRTEWVLVVGDQRLPEGDYFRLDMGDFVLFRASNLRNVDFRKRAWPGVIARMHGLSAPEPWGAWSIADNVVLEFLAPLPRRFELYLTAHGYGPNVGQAITAAIGSTERTFKLTESDQTIVLRFENPGSNTLRFMIPAPTSPQALGVSDDARMLGIGFVDLNVIPLGEHGAKGLLP